MFDGWGYVRLFDADNGCEPLDTYAIPEAHDPDFAVGFGDLTCTRWRWTRRIRRWPTCRTTGGDRPSRSSARDPATTAPASSSRSAAICDPKGNDFWGVETFVGDDGLTYILASDRDSGLWIFRDP